MHFDKLIIQGVSEIGEYKIFKMKYFFINVLKVYISQSVTKAKP